MSWQTGYNQIYHLHLGQFALHNQGDFKYVKQRNKIAEVQLLTTSSFDSSCSLAVELGFTLSCVRVTETVW